MTKSRLKTSTALIPLMLALACAGCGEQTKDDFRESVFLPKFNDAVAAKDYCLAVDIGQQRFEYYDDHQTSQEVLARRALEWGPRIDDAKTGCARQQWPKRKAQLEAELKKASDSEAEYENLSTRFAVNVVENSLREDSNGIRCLIDLALTNETNYAIAGFRFRSDSLESAYQFDDFQVTGEPLAVGETRKVSYCVSMPSKMQGHLVNNNVPAIKVDMSQVTLASGETVDLWQWMRGDPSHDFKRKIQAAQQQLLSEDPSHGSS